MPEEMTDEAYADDQRQREDDERMMWEAEQVLEWHMNYGRKPEVTNG